MPGGWPRRRAERPESLARNLWERRSWSPPLSSSSRHGRGSAASARGRSPSAFPAAALLVAWWANGAITGILVLWTAGLRLYLPVWLYGVALWAFAAAALGWLGDGSRRAGGMVLLLAAGFLLESTYAQALMLVALSLLAGGLAAGRAEDEGRAS